MACTDLSKTITKNVLVPVERVIKESKEVCEKVTKWIEEQIQKPVESWVSRQERRCKEQDCNWWCACCNKWFCWFVTVVVRVVTWVVTTVGKWVTEVICKVVTTVIGIVIEFFIKAVTRLIVIATCAVTDPKRIFSGIWDLINDAIDAFDDLIDLVLGVIDTVIEIIRDAGNLVGSIGRSFCLFGKIPCAIAGAVFGAIKGFIDWGADVIDIIRDAVDGGRDLFVGVISLNWCRIQKGLGIFNVVRGVTSVLRVIGMIFYVGPQQLLEKRNLETIIDDALKSAFSGDAVRLSRSRDRARLGGSPIGIPMELEAKRIGIRSSEFLRELHNSGKLDLYAVAGRFSNCRGKAVWEQFEGEVVYTGTRTTVSKSDLDLFLEQGPEAVASFTAYPITRDAFRNRLRVIQRKSFQVGIDFATPSIEELVIEDPRFVPLDAADGNDPAQKAIFAASGRPTSNEDLRTVPVIAIFGYVTTSLHGLTSWFRPTAVPPGVSPTGTTFRERFPELVFEYVAAHEVGHYVGLDHEGHTSPAEIMWKPILGISWSEAIGNFVFGSGEANFTRSDAAAVWTWITTTPAARDKILP